MAAQLRKQVVHVLSNFKNLVPMLADACPSTTFIGISESDILHESLQGAEILVADPPLLPPCVFELPKLKWVQSTFAGIDCMFKNLPRDKPHPSFVLTRLGGVFGPIMGEYVVGQIIARERKFNLSWEAQKSKQWVESDKMRYRLLSDITIGIVGFGDIGQEVAKYCKSMKMTVYCVQRRLTSPKLPFVDVAFSVQNLSDCLKYCDYFCNILPSTPATRGLLSGNVLKSCREKKTVVINIGRGDVVDEDDIVNALENEWIDGAILDVFEEEPLPGNSPLWSHPKITITPHISGLCSEKEIIQEFLVNFSSYQSGKPMKYVVDWSKGY